MVRRFIDAVRYIVRAGGILVIVIGGTAIALSAAQSSKTSAASLFLLAWCVIAAVLSWPRLPDAWRTDKPTEKQIKYATSLGIQVMPGMSKGQLSDAISAATGRGF